MDGKFLQRQGWVGVLLLAGILSCALSVANAAEITWTGAENSSWSDGDNWSGDEIPTIDDVVIVPVVANPPEVDAVDLFCGGLVLEEDATLEVLGNGVPSWPYGLYIVGGGDLDGDGRTDREEIDDAESLALLLDIDGDGIPNFADTDSDGDGLSDECEFAYGLDEGDLSFHPYEYTDADADHDGDGYSNAVECAADSDPTDPEVVPPPPIPLGNWVLFFVVGTLFVLLAIAVLRRARLRARIAGLLLILPVSMYVGGRVVLAATLSLDLASGQTLEQAVGNPPTGDTIEIDGSSVKPWNGQSTYLIGPVTIVADGGPIFLGGMHAQVELGVLGQGTLGAKSEYDEADHPMPLSDSVLAGSSTSSVFLGERLELTPAATVEWGFHEWQDDASGSDDPLSFQVLSDESIATAVFGPPGPDLAAEMDTGPPATAKADDAFSVVVKVSNIGQIVTSQSPWKDRLFLSRDASLDDGDFALGAAQTRTSELIPGSSYTVSFSVTWPDVAPGNYYVVAMTDHGGAVDLDENADNNEAAASITVLDANLAQ